MKKINLLLATCVFGFIIQGCAVNHLDEANKAENSGRYAEMLKHCQQAIQQAYPPPQAFKCIGDAQLKLGNRREAESAYLTYLEKMPADKEVRFALIDIYMVDGRQANALPHVEKILSLTPGDVEALVILGQIHDSQGHCKEAKDAYKEAVALSPHNSNAKAGLNKVEANCPDVVKTVKPKSTAPKPKPVVKKQTTFQGGGRALREDEW